MSEPDRKFTLTDLPLPARLVLATFLITVGIGYLSALVQLRVQHASAGEAMPGVEDVRRVFHGEEGKSQLERLLTAPMNLPQDGTGSMQFAIMDPGATKEAKDVKNLKDDPRFKAMSPKELAELVHQMRDGERLALIDWLKSGAPKGPYTNDEYRSDKLVSDLHLDDESPLITERFLDKNEDRKNVVKIQEIVQVRCVRCHRTGAGGAPAEFPLDSYENVALYTSIEKPSGMSLPKLAQSTHVHLLGFAVLWCMTGLIFACTGLPGWIRAIFGPWTLIAQVADIACWWLAGVDVRFADAIMVTGGLVGLGLCIQIVGGCFYMFRKGGWFLMLLVLILVGFGVATVYFKAVEPRLKNGHSATPAFVQKSSPT
jgi:hypothetical protein